MKDNIAVYINAENMETVWPCDVKTSNSTYMCLHWKISSYVPKDIIAVLVVQVGC
jgi:hypothetical protein